MIKKTSGFSLVELMVSLTLGLVITGGVITVFTSVQQNHQTTQGISMMQENSHFMRLFLTEAVNDIGHLHGCSTSLPLGNSVEADGVDYNFNIAGAIKGYEISGSSDLYGEQSSSESFPNTLTAASFVAGSDFFEIQTLTDLGSLATHPLQMGVGRADKLRLINKSTTLHDQEIYAYIAPDCTEAALFFANEVTSSGTNDFLDHTTEASTGLVQKFQNCVTETDIPYLCSDVPVENAFYNPVENSKIYQTEHLAYGIKQNDQDEDGIYSLVKVDLQGIDGENETLLLSGIREFKLSYGILNTDNANLHRVEKYVSAAVMTDADWLKVGSIKINAQLTALTDITGGISDNNSNTDNDIKSEIEQVITLRNRVFSE